MLSFEEKLSCHPRFNGDQLEKMIKATFRPLDVNAKKQCQKAVEYYNNDFKVVKRAVSGKSGKKFTALYQNDNEIVSTYLNKYHSIQPAFGAMCFYLLYYTGDNVYQVNRILHRTQLIKCCSNPDKGNDQLIIDWDKPYEETGIDLSEDLSKFELIKTKGEVFIITLKYKRG